MSFGSIGVISESTLCWLKLNVHLKTLLVPQNMPPTKCTIVHGKNTLLKTDVKTDDLCGHNRPPKGDQPF